MRLSTRPLLLAALALSFSACDNYNDGYDDGYYDGIDDAPTGGATVVDFELDATDYSVLNARTATYESDNIDSGTIRAAVEDALAEAGDGALVALYIDNQLVNESEEADQTTYTALPLSRGFDQLVLGDTDADGQIDDPVNVVGYTASYEYSFDNGDLYFDVVSSAPSSDFSTNPAVLFDFIAPQVRIDGVPQGLSELRFRLVTVPADEFNKKPVDLTDYAAVAAAYNLPD
jgi:hypothetical protein